MKHVLTASIAALLLVALTAPLVLAKPGDERPERRDGEMRDAHPPADKAMIAAEKAQHRGHRVADMFLITIDAQGLTKDNESYTISGSGQGLAKTRSVNDTEGALKGVAGFARLNVTLKDENGSVVKEGTIRVRFLAHQNETGAWHWNLVSAGKTPLGLPKLFLHGKNVTAADGVADLEGDGFALAKIQDGEQTKRLRLRLDADVHLAKA